MIDQHGPPTVEFEIQVSFSPGRLDEELNATIMADVAIMFGRDAADVVVPDKKEAVESLAIVLNSALHHRSMRTAFRAKLNDPYRLHALPVGTVPFCGNIRWPAPHFDRVAIH